MSSLPESFYEHLFDPQYIKPMAGIAYRWVHPDHPLPSTGPADSHCASAGSYINGQRMNAKGLHGVLYTALHSKVAAVEAWPEKEKEPLPHEHAVAKALKYFADREYQLFKITFELERVLDLTAVPSHVQTHLYGVHPSSSAACRGGSPALSPSQAIGWFALQLGMDGILRYSATYHNHWGPDAAKQALLLDILCPNLSEHTENTGRLKWKQIR